MIKRLVIIAASLFCMAVSAIVVGGIVRMRVRPGTFGVLVVQNQVARVYGEDEVEIHVEKLLKFFGVLNNVRHVDKAIFPLVDIDKCRLDIRKCICDSPAVNVACQLTRFFSLDD